MITELKLTNFKSWQSIEKMRLAPITGLFGTNSSGKSSILQLMLMLKQTIESSDRAQVLEFGDEKNLTNLGSFRETVYGHSFPGTMSFELHWETAQNLVINSSDDPTKTLFSTNKLGFGCMVDEPGSEKLAVKEMEYSLPGYRFRMTRKSNTSPGKYRLECKNIDEPGIQPPKFEFISREDRTWDLIAPIKFHGFSSQVFHAYKNAEFLSDLQLSLEKLTGRIYYLGPLREFPRRTYSWKGSEPGDMGPRGERVVDAMLAARERGAYISPGYRKHRLTLEQKIAGWLQELGLIHSFSVEPVAKESSIYQVKVRKTAASAEVLITDVGFGVSQILPVLVLCYFVPEGSTILLEQPEIHLHPSVQSGLADVFIDATKTRNVQIILESHSEHLLRRLQRRIAEEGISPDNAALYFCETGDAGSILNSLKLDDYGNITNWPEAFFGDEFGEMAAMTKAAMKRKKGLQK